MFAQLFKFSDIYIYFSNLFSFIPEQEISGNLNKLAGSSQLLSINVEGFERTVINEPSFKNFNTEGKTTQNSNQINFISFVFLNLTFKIMNIVF